MAAPRPRHDVRVLGSPWPGVHATDITSGMHFGRHWHAAFGIGLMLAGAHRSASGHRTVDAFAGDLVATNPGEVHDGRPLAAPSRRWCTVYIEPQVLAAHGAGGVALQPVFRDARTAAALRVLLARMQAWTGGTHGRSAADRLACDEALALVCAGLPAADTLPAVRGPDAGDLAADVARACLAGHLLDPPSLAELARLAGVGRFQLLRSFRRRWGITPHAWLVQQRAEHARGLIGRGATLAHAAAAAGFADQSHMTRAFTRRYGFTPGAWRKALGIGSPGSPPSRG